MCPSVFTAAAAALLSDLSEQYRNIIRWSTLVGFRGYTIIWISAGIEYIQMSAERFRTPITHFNTQHEKHVP